METVEQTLKSSGMKVTPQRVMLLKYILENPGAHLSAEDIHEHVKSIAPNIPAATVYNILKALSDKGIINFIELDGKALYESRTDPHINFQCLSCGSIEDYEISGSVEPILNNVRGIITNSTILLKGICSECTKTAKQ